MRIDPAQVVITYLGSLNLQEEFGDLFISADGIGREVGQAGIVCDHSGGERTVRHRMDRFDFSLNVYAGQKARAAALAYAVREALLEKLPGQAVGNAFVSDVAEIDAPFSFPDQESREARFVHQVSIYVFETGSAA